MEKKEILVGTAEELAAYFKKLFLASASGEEGVQDFQPSASAAIQIADLASRNEGKGSTGQVFVMKAVPVPGANMPTFNMQLLGMYVHVREHEQEERK